MRIDRIERSQHKKDRVLVFLEDGACLRITEGELVRFALRAGDELDGDTLAALRSAAGSSSAREKAAELIGRRALSRRDLQRKLKEKGVTETEARYAADWLEAIGALNDREYAGALVRQCAAKGWGPARIREKLYEKGVPRALWEEALEELPEGGDAIDRFLAQKLRGRAPEEDERRRLTAALRRRGFSWEEIRQGWERLGEATEDFFED